MKPKTTHKLLMLNAAFGAALAVALLVAVPAHATQIASGDEVVRQPSSDLGVDSFIRMVPVAYSGMPVLLAHSGVAPGSVLVRVNGMTLRPDQYKVDPMGAVILDSVVPRGARVDVSYQAIPNAEIRSGSLASALAATQGAPGDGGVIGFQEFTVTTEHDAPASLLDQRAVRAQQSQVYGAALQGVNVNGIQMDYGVLGSDPRSRAPMNGFVTGNDSGLLQGDTGPQATWAGVAAGDADGLVRGYYRSAEFDDDWAPAEGQGDQATVEAMRAYGFADQNDLFDPATRRTSAGQFTGTKWEDWMLETEPVRGLVVGTRHKTQEDPETGDVATLDTNTVGLTSGLTQFGYSQTTHEVRREAIAADPNREAETAAVSDSLNLSQGVVLNGKQAVLGFARARSHAEDHLAEIDGEGAETTQTSYTADQIQVLPFLNMGYSTVRTEVDDDLSPSSDVDTYKLNELRLSDSFALQASLVKSYSDGNADPTLDGLRRQTWTIMTPQGERMWLFNDQLGLTNALWTKETNEYGEDHMRRFLVGDLRMFGFNFTGTYDNETADYELNPMDREARTLSVARDISSKTTVAFSQTQRYEWGAEIDRLRQASATQHLGDFALTASKGILECASGARRPETALRGSYREDQEAGLRGGFAFVNHADSDQELGLKTREVRGAVPVGPVTLRGAYRDNPELASNGQHVPVEGEQKSVGVDVPVGALTVSVDRVENPTIMAGPTEQFLGQTATDLGFRANFGDHGAVALTDRYIQDDDNDFDTSSLTLDFSYRHDNVGDMSFLLYHNSAQRGHGNLPLGHGYRVSYGHEVARDLDLSLDIAKSFGDYQALTEGLPSDDTTLFVEMRKAF